MNLIKSANVCINIPPQVDGTVKDNQLGTKIVKRSSGEGFSHDISKLIFRRSVVKHQSKINNSIINKVII